MLATVGVMAIPLTLGIGLSVDATQVMLVRSRLGTAIDAAALAGARDMAVNVSTQSDSWKTEVTGMFWANFGQNPSDKSKGFLGTTVNGPTITQLNGTTVQVSAQASVSTMFMQVMRMLDHSFPSTVTVSAKNQAVRAQKGMEIALVLDNTGSMKGAPIQAVRTAATELVNILYGHTPDDPNASLPGQDTQPNFWLSIVPFTAEVNVGPGRTDWLQPGSIDRQGGAYKGNYDATDTKHPQWMGCVMARANGDDATDKTPSQSAFTPFV